MFFSQNIPIPMCHRQFLRILSQNIEYVERFCNKRKIFLILHVVNGI